VRVRILVLIIHHEKGMCHILLPSVACPYFIAICGLSGSTIFSHKWHNFLKKATEYNTCVLIFSTTFV